MQITTAFFNELFEMSTFWVKGLSVEGQKSLRFHKKYLHLCTEDARPMGLKRFCNLSQALSNRTHPMLYLTDVLQVLDVVALSAHDLVDDVGPHLVSVLQRLADAQTAVTGVGVSVLHLAGTLS